jgi:glycosyltransferase involved in cell wall biosynthesis
MSIDSRPRVAVVYPIPFGEEGLYGGGERYAVELARALSRRVPTRLLTFGSRPGRRREGDLEIRTYRPLRYVRGERINPLSFRFLGALRDVDVIHCTSWNTLVTDFSILAARLLAKRVFVTDIGGGGSLSLAGRLPLARWVDGFLLLAPQGGTQFAAYRDKWDILYAGIDVDRYRPAPEVTRRGVLYVGRLLPHKGINYLVEAMDPEVPLRIVGRPYHEEYLRLLRKLAAGKRVTFITDATDDAIVREYQAAAVAVLPSVYTDVYGATTFLPELLGFTGLEAMSCGTPLLGTDVGGIPEVVDDGVTGYLVPPNDPGALRDRIRLLLGDPAIAARLGAAARQRVLDKFTWEAVTERCLAAYAGTRGIG